MHNGAEPWGVAGFSGNRRPEHPVAALAADAIYRNEVADPGVSKLLRCASDNGLCSSPMPSVAAVPVTGIHWVEEVGGEDKILKIKQALIQSCQNSPPCMAENGYRLFSRVPITFEPARTWAEYQQAFHSMQEDSEAVAAEEKLRAQSGQP